MTMNIADLHCDTIMKIWFSHRRGDPMELRDTAGRADEIQIDLEKLRRGGSLIQNFAIFMDQECPENFDGQMGDDFLVRETGADEARMDLWKQFREMAKIYHQEIARNQDVILEARTYEEILRNREEGKISAVLTTEEGGVLDGQLERLDTLYEEGVRMMTVTWNYENCLGYPAKLDQSKGLKPFGIEAVKRMEELGIIPDVSHLSDAGFYDVAAHISGPFVASHSNARALANVPRNLTDHMIRTLSEHGGLTGLNFFPDFVEEPDPAGITRCTLKGLVKQARYITNVGGMDVLGLGSDFDGGVPAGQEITSAADHPMILEALHDGGFTWDQVDKISHGNVMRVYKEVLR